MPVPDVVHRDLLRGRSTSLAGATRPGGRIEPVAWEDDARIELRRHVEDGRACERAGRTRLDRTRPLLPPMATVRARPRRLRRRGSIATSPRAFTADAPRRRRSPSGRPHCSCRERGEHRRTCCDRSTLSGAECGRVRLAPADHPDSTGASGPPGRLPRMPSRAACILSHHLAAHGTLPGIRLGPILFHPDFRGARRPGGAPSSSGMVNRGVHDDASYVLGQRSSGFTTYSRSLSCPTDGPRRRRSDSACMDAGAPGSCRSSSYPYLRVMGPRAPSGRSVMDSGDHLDCGIALLRYGGIRYATTWGGGARRTGALVLGTRTSSWYRDHGESSWSTRSGRFAADVSETARDPDDMRLPRRHPRRPAVDTPLSLFDVCRLPILSAPSRFPADGTSLVPLRAAARARAQPAPGWPESGTSGNRESTCGPCGLPQFPCRSGRDLDDGRRIRRTRDPACIGLPIGPYSTRRCRARRTTHPPAGPAVTPVVRSTRSAKRSCARSVPRVIGRRVTRNRRPRRLPGGSRDGRDPLPHRAPSGDDSLAHRHSSHRHARERIC